MAENRAGLVSTLVVGIGGLIIIVAVSFLIIATINDADLLRAKDVTVVTNESGTLGWGLLDSSDTANGVPPLDFFSVNNRDYSIITVWNVSNGAVPEIVPSTYYTLNRTGSLLNSTARVYNMTNVTYSYYIQTRYEATFDELTGNYTSGVRNVSTKIPTVLLISAIILLLGIIVLFIVRAKSMQLETTGGKGGTGFGGGSSGNSVDGSVSGSL